MTGRRAALALGLVLLGLVVIFAVPGNGIFETGEQAHQLLGTLLSHLAVLLLLWSLFPSLRRLVPRLDQVSERALGGMLAASLVAPLAIVIVLGVVAPHATHQLVTREWGVVEPLQVALYAIAVALCRAIRAELGDHDPARAIYGAGAVVAGVFLLEEMDYLGVLNAVVRASGAPGGRIGRKHIGGIHDVLDAGSQVLGLAAVAIGMAVALAALWMLLGRYRAPLRRELARRSAVPLVIYAASLVLAETIDFDDQLLAGLPGVRGMEEPLELTALLALNAALVLRLQGARREAPVSILALDPPGSGAGRR
jgi:hypothetical protein